MPTILRYIRYKGYRFYFCSHEPNEPPHIHVDKDNLSAKFWLSPVFLARNIRFLGKELRKIQAMVESNKIMFLEAWNEYFS
ncbi:DUF4160 domain-containing protein [Cyanobacterium sp. Dongsha4]|uniref:DUF4160 domain-containing protein n=1 Tax=Cyanobacterium sp. DS4 TaxID=2878255 RepID=UPI002E807EC7|nr:DUF4160 domain-containing protein [Cyanobacterium sp. Dongsha4]WVL01362.1 DUF4160 domain-containing protein [Cyanobacterium sp. Dongsha4]